MTSHKSMMIFVALLVWWGTCRAEATSFSVSAVAIDMKSCLSTTPHQMEFACHRLRKGTGLVVATREYTKQIKVDDDAYFKMTILFLKTPSPGKVISIPNRSIFIFRSYGLSSFPGSSGCYGTADSGYVVIESIDKTHVKFKYQLNFSMQSPDGWKGECSVKDLREGANDAPFINFRDLNPWLGLQMKTNDVWNEAHPPEPASPVRQVRN